VSLATSSMVQKGARRGKTKDVLRVKKVRTKLSYYIILEFKGDVEEWEEKK